MFNAVRSQLVASCFSRSLTRSLSKFHVSRFSPEKQSFKSSGAINSGSVGSSKWKAYEPRSFLKEKPTQNLGPKTSAKRSWKATNRENEHFFKLLKPIAPIVPAEPSAPIVAEFVRLTNLSADNLPDTQELKEHLQRLEISLENISENDLFAILSAVKNVKNETFRHILFRVFTPLDHAMAKWLKYVSIGNPGEMQKVLQALNVFYSSNSMLRGQYVNSLRHEMLKRINSLDLESSKILLFVINLSRNPIPIGDRNNLEKKLLQILPSMRLNDISLVTGALFKTETKIVNQDIIEEILNKLEIELTSSESNIHSITYSSVFKFLRYSYSERNASRIRKLIKSIDERVIGKLSLYAIAHLSLLASTYLQSSKLIVKELIAKCCDTDSGDVRMKDMTMALRTAIDFGFDKELVPDQVLNHFIEHILSQPRQYSLDSWLYHYLGFTVSVASFGTFPEQLIEKCLKMKNDPKVSFEGTAVDMVHQWLQLHSLLALNRPDLGPILSEKEVEKLASKIIFSDPSKIDKIRNRTSFEYTFNQLFHGAKYAFRPSRVAVKRLLPESYFPEIVVTVTDEMRSKIMSAEQFNLKPGSFEGCLVISLKHRSHFSDVYDTIPRGYYKNKVKLLQSLGFSVLDIHWMQVCEEPVQMIGVKIKNLLRDRIKKGSIDAKFSSLLDETDL